MTSPIGQGMKPNNSQAFTLVELLLVIVILGVLIGVAAPNLGNTFSSVQLKKTADDAAFLLRYAQGQASAKGEAYRLVFNEAFNRYWLERGVLDDEGNPGNFSRIPARMGRDYKIPKSIRVIGEAKEILCYPDGSMSKAKLVFSSQDVQWVVSTMEQRGYVAVFEDNEE